MLCDGTGQFQPRGRWLRISGIVGQGVDFLQVSGLHALWSPVIQSDHRSFQNGSSKGDKDLPAYRYGLRQRRRNDIGKGLGDMAGYDYIGIQGASGAARKRTFIGRHASL
jgi:hypothetical protein